MAIPQGSPEVQENLICRNCSQPMEPIIDSNADGKLNAIYYVCRNEAKKCNYLFTSKRYAQGIAQSIKPEDKEHQRLLKKLEKKS